MNEISDKTDCTKCHGTGKITDKFGVVFACDKCWGKKQLDWIEQLMGVSLLQCQNQNIAIGYQTLYKKTTGSYNTAIGYKAGHNFSNGR